MYYALAKESFKKNEYYSLANELDQKMAVIDKRIEGQADLKNEADEYLKEANARIVKDDKESAKVLYILSKDIYTQLGLDEEVKLIDEMLQGIDKQLASNGEKSSGESNE